MLQSANTTTTLAFWLMGALNNVPYIVMLAGAKSISEGGTALVFLANVTPGFLVKLSSPYWFEKVSYQRRIMSGSILMTMSFILVATFGFLKKNANASKRHDGGGGASNVGSSNNSDNNNVSGVDFYLIMQLLGVACSSAQIALGEATMLALSGKVDSLHDRNQNRTTTPESENSNLSGDTQTTKKTKAWSITAYSSGTGLSGVLGFAYVFLLTELFRLPLTMALYIAMIIPVIYYGIYLRFLHQYTALGNGSGRGITNYETLNEEDMGIDRDMFSETSHTQQETNTDDSKSSSVFVIDDYDFDYSDENTEIFADNLSTSELSLETEQIQIDDTTKNDLVKSLTTMERLKLTFSFWPFMIPLFVVYASEYALLSGVWTAIGFPVDDESARISFYMKSNWMYQVGVFISRSSGAFCTAPMWALWLMAFLQCINLVVYYLIASYHFWYNHMLFVGCFYVGLLGGGVYVNGYIRVNKDLPASISREFALSTVSVADSLGIVLADFGGLFIQSCLYKTNGIDGAVVQCPF